MRAFDFPLRGGEICDGRVCQCSVDVAAIEVEGEPVEGAASGKDMFLLVAPRGAFEVRLKDLRGDHGGDCVIVAPVFNDGV